MSRIWIAGIVGLGLAACSSAAAKEPERDADRWLLDQRAVDRTLVAGTLVQATIHSAPSQRRNTPGESLMATVSADVRNAHRRVVIPAGCPVGVKIAAGLPASPDGKIVLDVTSVTVRGHVYALNVTIEVAAAAVAPGTRILFVLPEGFTAARRLD